MVPPQQLFVFTSLSQHQTLAPISTDGKAGSAIKFSAQNAKPYSSQFSKQRQIEMTVNWPKNSEVFSVLNKNIGKMVCDLLACAAVLYVWLTVPFTRSGAGFKCKMNQLTISISQQQEEMDNVERVASLSDIITESLQRAMDNAMGTTIRAITTAVTEAIISSNTAIINEVKNTLSPALAEAHRQHPLQNRQGRRSNSFRNLQQQYAINSARQMNSRNFALSRPQNDHRMQLQGYYESVRSNAEELKSVLQQIVQVKKAKEEARKNLQRLSESQSKLRKRQEQINYVNTNMTEEYQVEFNYPMETQAKIERNRREMKKKLKRVEHVNQPSYSQPQSSNQQQLRQSRNLCGENKYGTAELIRSFRTQYQRK